VSAERTEGVHLAPDLVPGRRIAAIAAGAVVLSAAVVAWVYFALERRAAALGASEGQPATTVEAPGPAGIFATPIGSDRAGERLRERDAEVLSTYGWVDRERGIVRIPIERAIDIVTMTAASEPGAREGSR
jgi:hypothetical protein